MMKKLMCCLLLSMYAFVAQAQNTPKPITLFGYTLKCDSQVVGKKEDLGGAADVIEAECLLSNTSSVTSDLKVSIRTLGGTSNPTVEFVESMIDKVAYQNDEKYIFSCPGKNKVIGGYIHSNGSSPHEYIILETPTSMVLIHHYLTPQTPMFSSKRYLNQLCHWKPW